MSYFQTPEGEFVFSPTEEGQSQLPVGSVEVDPADIPTETGDAAQKAAERYVAGRRRLAVVTMVSLLDISENDAEALYDVLR